MLQQLNGGSNCAVYLKDNRTIVKYFGENLIDQEIGNLIIKDFFEIRLFLDHHGVSIPKLFDIFLSSKTNATCYIYESYEGKSIRDRIRDKDYYFKNSETLINKSIEFINSLPESMPLDINPGNITFNDTREHFCIIDFIPPDIWKYRDTQYESSLTKVFPSSARCDYDHKKKSSYYNTKDRVTKFKEYVEKELINC